MIESILINLKDTMHIVSSGLLMPAIVVLLLLLAYTAVELGGVLVEAITRQRR